MKTLTAIVSAAFLAGCASYDGRGLVVGQSSHDDITLLMGTPAMQWTDTTGSRQLAYPRGPMGVHTFMVRLGPDGKLLGIENVMDNRTFANIKEGMSDDAVLKILGPSRADWTEYFARRDELVWGWRYCDDWSQLARFFVLFDGTKRTVRSTMTLRESQAGNCGGDRGGCWCSR